MDQLSKKIIKALESSPNYTCMFYVDKEPFSDIAPYPLVSAAIKYLTDNGYLDEIVRNERVIGIKLSHKCLHRKYFTWVSIKSFLFRSILTPILVSFFYYPSNATTDKVVIMEIIILRKIVHM